MTNFRFMLSSITYTPSTTSEDSTFPVTNLIDLRHLFRPWKATTQNVVLDVTCDVGAGNTVSGLAPDPAIFLDDCNLTSVRIQGNSTPSWSAPPWDQLVTINRNDWDRRRKGFFRLADLDVAPFAYQYLNLRIPAQTGTDGQNYHIGRNLIGPTTELLSNPLYGIQYKRMYPSITTDLLDGGFEVSEMGECHSEMTIEQQIFGAAELSQELTIEALTPGQLCVMWDASLGGSQHAWVVSRTEDPELTTPWLDEYRGRWTFREVT